MRASSGTVLYCRRIWLDASDMWTCFGMSWPWPPLGSFQTRDSSVSQCIGCGFFFQHRKDSCLHCSAVRVPALTLTIMNLFFFFFWFLAMPCSKQDLSSPALTRDWTCDSSSPSMESQPLNHQGSPWPSWILTPWGWSGQKENIRDPSEHDNWDLIMEGLRAGVLLGLVFLAKAAFLTGCWVLKTL